jgi:tetratricopeptide (TPR) repeat protein
MLSIRSPEVADPVRGKGKYVGNSEKFEVVEASIELKDWDPNTPYLKVLKELRSKGADDEALYAEYLHQRQEYEMSTAFYFDVSNYFYQENMQKYAARILSNLTEFKLDNTDLLRVLAWRLRDMKDLDDAILIARKNIKLRPSHNHLWHELALLLEMRARQNMNAVDAHEALECYKKAAFELYENWYARSERAVALVSIEEFNALASWIERQNWPNKKPVIPAIDQNFKKLLDTDLRIIMSWDSDNTDIDLHITEPTTEKIYYSHKRSVEGGLLSADITRGFGPEEYLMKEAPKGEYKISTNYYASHEQNLIGAVTITTTVFKNWGRPNQSQQSIVYRLENPDHNRSDTNDDCDDDDDNCSEDSTIRIGTITVE